MATETAQKKWYEKLPHPYVILFLIIVLAAVMTYLVPAGEFERVKMVVGSRTRMGVKPGTFHYIAQNPVGFFDMFLAIPKGLISAASIMVIVFASGGLFKVLEKTGAMENGVGVAVKHLGTKHETKLLWIVTFIFAFLGAAVGFENLIALVPIAVFVSIALGGDLLVGAGISIGALGIAFATSPINPYTVGTSDFIAQLPMFSGWPLRTAFCLTAVALTGHHTIKYFKKVKADPSKSFVKEISTEGFSLTHAIEDYSLSGQDKLVLGGFGIGLAVMLWGIFQHHWYINEMSAVFVILAIVLGFMAKMGPSRIAALMIDGASGVAGGALVVGVARAIQVVLEQGQIQDTIVNSLAAPLQHMSVTVSAVLMTLVHCAINFFIPSGSGQAMATMPIMIPLSDLIGMSRQTAILAFQIGDGVTNMIYPTLGGLLAMLALARVPFDKWFRFAFPLIVKILLASWAFLVVAVMIGY